MTNGRGKSGVWACSPSETLVCEPCPFCGGHLCQSLIEEDGYVGVLCNGCGASGPRSDNEQGAIQKWDKRRWSEIEVEPHEHRAGFADKPTPQQALCVLKALEEHFRENPNAEGVVINGTVRVPRDRMVETVIEAAGFNITSRNGGSA